MTVIFNTSYINYKEMAKKSDEKPKPKVNRQIDGQLSGGRKVRNTFVDPPKSKK